MQPLNPTDHLEIATVTQKAELAFCPGPAARSESPKQKYMGLSRLAIQQRPASWCYFTIAGQHPLILSDEAATVRCQAVSLRLTQRQKIDGYASRTRNSQHTTREAGRSSRFGDMQCSGAASDRRDPYTSRRPGPATWLNSSATPASAAGQTAEYRLVPCYNTQMPCLSDGDVPPPHSTAPFRYQHLLSHWQTGRRLILWAKQQARRNRADHAEVRRNCFFLSAPQAARPYRLGQTVAHQVTKRLGDSRNNGFSYAAVGIPGPASPAWSRVPPRVGESIRRDSLAVA